jgi:hypothetical protein
MPKATVAGLKRCIKAARGDQVKIQECEADFERDGGTKGTEEGGKVFTDPDGGEVFVTTGGKVF